MEHSVLVLYTETFITYNLNCLAFALFALCVVQDHVSILIIQQLMMSLVNVKHMTKSENKGTNILFKHMNLFTSCFLIAFIKDSITYFVVGLNTIYEILLTSIRHSMTLNES